MSIFLPARTWPGCVIFAPCSCVPGFYSSGCAVSSVRDARCLACDNGPFSGNFDWTAGCDYACSRGYFLNQTSFSSCLVLSCDPGTYASNCTAHNNSQCVACEQPAGSFFVWTEGCRWQCMDGYFLSQGVCTPCSDPLCFSGSYATECLDEEDSVYVECPQPAGLFAWVGGCDFVCLQGSYRSVDGCFPCSQPVCAAGYQLVACNQTSDARCKACEEPLRGPVVWTHGCDRSCVAGVSWLNGSRGCVPCASPICANGWALSACTPSEDAFCSPCSSAPGNGKYVLGCEYVYNAGFYGPKCLACTTPQCPPGTLELACTAEADASCQACAPPTAGSFFWTGDLCGFGCLSGFYLTNGGCMPCAQALVCPHGYEFSGCTSTENAQCVLIHYFQLSSHNVVWGISHSLLSACSPQRYSSWKCSVSLNKTVHKLHKSKSNAPAEKKEQAPHAS